MPLITIDPERCRKDGLCVQICQKVFSQKEKDSVPEVVHEEFCNSCGHCVIVCPHGAIRQLNSPPEGIYPVQNDLMPSYEQVREMIRTRRSTRTFQDRPVEKEIIERVIDGARFAPSAKNTQSTQFIVVQEKTLLQAIASMTAERLGRVAKRLENPLVRKLYQMRGATNAGEVSRLIGQVNLIARKMREGNDLVLFGVPVLILFHADRRIRFAEANANLAIQNATLLARSLGLGSFYTGYVVTACTNDGAIPRLVKLPDKHRVYGGLALGYPKIQFSKWIERNPPKITWM